jgi:hypothetical protein
VSYRIIDQQPARVGPWVCNRFGGIWTPENSSAIGLECQGELIAGTIYSEYYGRSIVMHTAIERMNREFLWYCFYYPFEELKVEKVLGLVDSFNDSAIQLDRHLGFVLEASIKDAGPQGDLLVFSMTRDQCRWLNAVKRPGVHHGKRQRPENTRLHRRSECNGAG